MTSYKGSYVALANTTAAATAIRTQLRTTIPANAAWSLVESTTMNAGAVPCDVYKCAAAGSGMSADFYIAVMQDAAVLMFGLAEGYNTVTHKPQRPAMKSTAIVQPLQADGGLLPATTEIDWFNGTFNPGGGSLTVLSSSAANVVLNMTATTDDYLIVVAKDCVALSVRTLTTTNTGLLIVGAYDSAVPNATANDPLPILCASNAPPGAATRQPMCGGTSIGWAGGLNGSSGMEPVASANLYNTFNLGVLGNPPADNFDLYLGAPSADRVALKNSYTAGSATAGRDKTGWLRGSYRLLRLIPAVAGTVWGDTAQINGETYHALSPSSSAASSFWVELDPA